MNNLSNTNIFKYITLQYYKLFKEFVLSMVYKRYIKNGDKVYGPYWYKNYRKNGKVINQYLRKVKEGEEVYNEKKTKKKKKK